MLPFLLCGGRSSSFLPPGVDRLGNTVCFSCDLTVSLVLSVVSLLPGLAQRGGPDVVPALLGKLSQRIQTDKWISRLVDYDMIPKCLLSAFFGPSIVLYV